MLCTGLRHFFPGLLIVGEETTEYKGHIELDLNAITLHHHPSHVELSENIPIEEFVVWIDPIDNTRGFIKGTLDAVTILVGLSRKERAYLGVVGLPYQKIDKEIVYEPEVLVGTVEGKKAFTISASQ